MLKIADERQVRILEMVREKGFVSIEHLAAHFEVTTQTIRRVVNRLCDQGLLRRIHGGVSLPVAAAPAAAAAAAADDKFRTWTDVSGTYQVEAELVEATGAAVKLKLKKDGKIVTVPLEKLSEADREFLQSK